MQPHPPTAPPKPVVPWAKSFVRRSLSEKEAPTDFLEDVDGDDDEDWSVPEFDGFVSVPKQMPDSAALSAAPPPQDPRCACPRVVDARLMC